MGLAKSRQRNYNGAIVSPYKSRRVKVIVLGAGVAGVTTAYYLLERGHEVEVLDRQPGPALETSFANGGQVSVSHTRPWATPYTPLKILRWLGRENSPLLFRMRFDPMLWRWGARFLRNCTQARVKVNVERALRVALYSRHCFAELREATGIEYQHRRRGILHFFENPREFARHRQVAGDMARYGLEQQVRDPAGCIAIEPALAPFEKKLAGGLYSPNDESGDAYLFSCRLAEICAERGGIFRWGAAIGQFRSKGGRILGVEINQGLATADAYVLALGSYSPLLLRPLGIYAPIYPTKGYSVTLPIKDASKAPKVSLTDDGNKLVFSRLGNRLRVAGTAEMTGYDTSLNTKRTRFILERTFELFAGCGDPAEAVLWTGLRSKTPDSAPIIGQTPYPNLVTNTGHGALGWTMSCGSGKAVAALVSGDKPEISLHGLGVDRFRSW